MAEWIWLPNATMTRLHAVLEDNSYLDHRDNRVTVTACWGEAPVSNVPMTGHQPPRCKRCERVVSAS